LVICPLDFSADTPAVVEITNEGADGYVIADAVQFISIPDR